MDTAERLRGAGLRVTGGRLQVLAALATHPHADAETVRRTLVERGYPMSIQSVHNVLGDLADAGVLGRIEPAGSPVRYENRVGDNHHHIVCRTCGAVEDVDCVIGEAPCLTPSAAAGFTVERAEVVFWGRCPACASGSRTTT